MEDFDPFNISYDLLKIEEPELSMRLFFKYYGRILEKKCSEKELELRNKKIQYCLNQYIVYYRKRKEYSKAAEIALLDSQKEIAADLFKKAKQEKKKPIEILDLGVDDIKTSIGDVKTENEDKVKKDNKKVISEEINKCLNHLALLGE